MALLRFLVCILWVALCSATNPTRASTPEAIMALRQYSPEEGVRVRPFSVVSYHIGRDVNYGHVKSFETILKSGLDIMIFPVAKLPDLRLNDTTKLYKTETIQSISEISQLILSAVGNKEIARFYKTPGRKNGEFICCKYVLSSDADHEVWNLRLNFPRGGHEFAMRLVVDHIPDPVILGTCDSQVISMMQKAFGLKDTNQNRDVMFSLIRMDDYSSDPPSVLTIYTLENDDHDAFYFKLIKAVLDCKDKCKFITNVGLKRFHEKRTFCLLLFFNQLLDQQQKDFIKAIFQSAIGNVTSIVDVPKTGRTQHYASIRIELGTPLLKYKKNIGKRLIVSQKPLDSFEAAKTIIMDRSVNGNYFEFVRPINGAIEDLGSHVSFDLPPFDKKLLFLYSLRDLFYNEDSVWARHLAQIKYEPNPKKTNCMNLTCYFRLVLTSETDTIAKVTTNIIMDVIAEMSGPTVSKDDILMDARHQVICSKCGLEISEAKTIGNVCCKPVIKKTIVMGEVIPPKEEKRVEERPGNFDEHEEAEKMPISLSSNGFVSMDLVEFDEMLLNFENLLASFEVAPNRLTCWRPILIVDGLEQHSIFKEQDITTGHADSFKNVMFISLNYADQFQLALENKSASAVKSGTTASCTLERILPINLSHVDGAMQLACVVIDYLEEHQVYNEFVRFVFEIDERFFTLHLDFTRARDGNRMEIIETHLANIKLALQGTS